MFALRYGLRQWNKNKLQTGILLSGLTLFCIFTINLIATAPALFSDRQSWMSSEGNYVTIGLMSHDEKFNMIDKKKLERYRQSPALEELMMITLRTAMGMEDREGNSLSEASLSYLPENFITNFSAQLPEVFGNLDDAGVLISYDYWQEMGEKNIEDILFRFPLTNSSLPAVGILPEGFELFQGVKTDIVMTERQVETTFGMHFGKFSPSPEEKKQILLQLREHAAMRYGVAKLKPGYSADDVIEILDEEAEATNKAEVVLMTDSGSWKPQAVNGLQFHPHKRGQLLKQWWMLLGLTLSFLLLDLFNLLTSNFSHYLQREQEFQTRRAVGATSENIFKQLLLENAMLGLVAAVIGCTLSLFVLSLVEREMVLVANLSLSATLSAVVLSAFVVILSSMLIGVLPFVLLNRKVRFSRSKNGGQSALQSLLNSSNIIVQSGLAFLAISCAVSLWLTQQQRLDQTSIDTDVEQLTYYSVNPKSEKIINVEEWQSKLTHQKFELAYSLKSLIAPRADATRAGLEAADSPRAQPVQIMSVSDNYFSVLGVTDYIGELNPSDLNNVVVNYSAANLLGFEQPSKAIGQQLYIKNHGSYRFSVNEPIIITGVVSDLPHSGLNQGAQPMIYNIVRASVLEPSRIRFFVKPEQKQEATAWLIRQEKTSDGVFNMRIDGNLGSLLKQQDEEWFLLARVVLVLTMLVCALAATSLYQQVAAYLIQRTRRYAVMQAVGAQMNDIVKSISLELTPKALMGLAVGAFAVVLFNDWFKEEFYAELLSFSHILVSLIIFVVLIFVSYFPAIFRQLSRPIQRILHEE